MKKRYYIYIFIFLSFGIFYYLLVNPILLWKNSEKIEIKLNEEDLRNHVSFLVWSEIQRAYRNIDEINRVADYIYGYFEKSWCDETNFQKYDVNGSEYKNVICRFNWKSREKIIVWAHYDVYWEYSWEEKMVYWTYWWADDNASWVAWVLELARLVWENKIDLKNDIEFIAYTLEEPSFFATEEMWSFVHAKSMYEKKEKIKYMISLEMIWYFTDEEIQEYPIRFLKRIYPKKWNFIVIVWQFFDLKIKEIKKNMISFSDIDTWSISAPNFIPWVDFSDHRNYWHYWYNAYMITDTAFFRNKNYHTSEDTIDKLDFWKMKEVVKWVYWVVMN